MPIVITSPEGQQVFNSREEVKLSDAPQPADPVVENQDVDSEQESNTPAPPEKKEAAEEKDEFSYLDDEEESEDGDDDEDSDGDDEEEGEAQPKKSGFKKRIDKLTHRLREQEAMIADLKARSSSPKPADRMITPAEEEMKEPVVEDFEEYKDYYKALAKYEVVQERKAMEQRHEEATIRAEAQKLEAKYNERVEEAKKRYGSDKWQKAQQSDAPLTLTMRSELIQSEFGPDLVFFLANNPEEARRIATSTPNQQIKELTKLEMRVKNKLSARNGKEVIESKGKVSKAPAPAQPISSKANGAKDPDKMTYAEFKAWRSLKK